MPKDIRPDNGNLFPAIRREPLSRRVAQLLKQQILVEGLTPGHRLPAERRLADRLNVSRTVLREALSLLIGEGIVERRSAHALCVADFDRARVAADFAPVDAESIQMRDLIELRAIIELGSIETIVQRVTESQLQEIERWVLDGEHRAANREPIEPADAQFHAALLRALDNRAVDDLLPLIQESMRQALLLLPRQLAAVGTTADYRATGQHRQIFEALCRGDVAAARAQLVAHLEPYLRRDGSVTSEPLELRAPLARG